MSRWQRALPDGVVQHVVNRASRRGTLFHEEIDYLDFVELLAEAGARHPVDLGAFALMPTHFHLVLRPRVGAALSAYMQWLMNAHISQYRERYGGRGEGHIYQGRYRATLVYAPCELPSLVRYVEANAAKAGLVGRAEEWPWCSLASPVTPSGRPLICPDVFPRPANWVEAVNAAAVSRERPPKPPPARRGRPPGRAVTCIPLPV